VSETLHRLCVEALTNVRRHAAATTSVHVSVTVEPTRAALEVTDDGTATGGIRRARPRGGSGLRTAQARVEALGGTFAAGPLPDGQTPGGWCVRADLPLRPAY
jgi:signal transduction histidine kinase